MIHVIVGLDGVAAERLTNHLIGQFDPSRQSTSVLDGRTATPAQIIGQIGTGGFFGAGRVVVVTDFTAKLSKTSGRGASRDASADFAEIVANTRPENLLILVDTSVTGIPAHLKKVLPKDAQITVCDPPRGPQLVAWLQEMAQAAGGAMDAATARYLAARLYPQTWASVPNNPRYDRPPDTIRLANEIAKLVCAAAPGPITTAVVDELVTPGESDRIFRFSDAAAQGDLATALTELQHLLDAGEEPPRLLAQLAQQAELLAAIDAADRRDPGTIARDLGLSSPARVTALAASRRKGALPGAAQIAAMTESDRGQKQGILVLTEDPLYAYLTKLARKRSERSMPLRSDRRSQ